jgi:predicted phage baseplate assembly protein
MPLEDRIPVLDDRTFEGIMRELQTRIARYTPEWKPAWTDLNHNDPGVTMAQVFAWLSEMLIFRMNRVPEVNYYKFLQLIGIECNAAEPSSAEITFPVKEEYEEPYVIVPLRTQVSAESSDSGAPVIFETERALTALSARLASVQAYDGDSYTLVTTENTEASEGFEPFGHLAGENCAILLGFSYKGDFPHSIGLDLAFWTFPEEEKSDACRCGTTDAAYGPATIRWEYWNGSTWGKADLLKDETLALTRSGHVYLKTPPKGSMLKTAIGDAADELYWFRGRVTRTQYERPPMLLAVRHNTVAVRQAETLSDEVLGGSTGRRDQIFTLSRMPVLKGTLLLEIDEGEGFQEWTEVEDFFASSATDHHYVLDRTNGEVRFGDGVNGGIPVGNPANPSANVVARIYRVGGGSAGNLEAGAIKNLVSAVDGLDSGAIGNLMAAEGGRDEESIEEAKKRAPLAIKSRSRAVTAEDFEYFAMQCPTIKRARALPLYHPDFPGVKVPGVVTVIVVPDGDSAAPIPSQGTLRTVCRYLDRRRLLTAEVYVIKPAYHKVEISSEVIVNDDADVGEVKSGIVQVLETFFHPLKGGEDGLGWPFGGSIYYSRIYQQVFSVKGIKRIALLKISLDGGDPVECKDVEIGDGELVCSGRHDVQTRYDFEEGG